MEYAYEPFDMRRLGPAIDLGIDTAREKLGVNMEPLKRNFSGLCPYEPPVGILSELYYLENIRGLIGPACSQSLLAAARLAQYLKLPMVTGLGDLSPRKKDVDMFKSLTKLSYDVEKLSCKYTELLQVILMYFYHFYIYMFNKKGMKKSIAISSKKNSYLHFICIRIMS
jgi:hypothetical protein